MHSCLYYGWVRHRRLAPRPHAFRYRLFMVYVDLDEIDDFFRRRWLWSARRPALARLRREDYLGDTKVSLKQAVADLVERETGTRPTGPIRMLTHLRYFGFVFNPVSFYYCFDATGERVETIVAEVTNTPWGERRAYALPRRLSVAPGEKLRFRFGKDFHISPFMPMDLDFDWRFTAPGEQLVVHMDNHRAGEKIFDATLMLRARAFNGASAAWVLTRFPLMTLKVIGAIYWQALKLFLKRIPFHTHPAKRRSAAHGGAETAKHP